MKEKRVINYDLLRCFAAFFVILIHVNSHYLYLQNVHTVSFHVLNIYTSISRFSALVFIMISGAMFLDPKRNVSEDKIKHHIIKSLIALFVINGLSIIYFYYGPNGFRDFGAIWQIFKRTISGDLSAEQLWFLYEMIFLYFLTPYLRKIIKNSSKKELKILIIFGVLFTIFIPTITSYSIFKELSFSRYFVGEMDVSFSIKYLLYYILGYYTNTYYDSNNKKNNIIVFILGVVGFITTILLGSILSEIGNGFVLSRGYYYFSINVFLETVSVFILFKNLKLNGISKKFENFILFFSSKTYGIYLFHMILLNVTYPFVLKLPWSPIIIVPLYSLLLYFISFGVTIILEKISFVNKYLFR